MLIFVVQRTDAVCWTRHKSMVVEASGLHRVRV